MSHKIDVALTGTGLSRHYTRQPSVERWPWSICSTRLLSFTPVFEFIQTCINPLHSCRTCTWKKAEVVSDRLTFHHLDYLNPNRFKHFAKPKDNGLPIDLCSVQMFSCVCQNVHCRLLHRLQPSLAADKRKHKLIRTASPLLNRHKRTPLILSKEQLAIKSVYLTSFSYLVQVVNFSIFLRRVNQVYGILVDCFWCPF